VAIPLRENVPKFIVSNALEFGWKFRPDPRRLEAPQTNFKLLKSKTLRIGYEYSDYTIIRLPKLLWKPAESTQ
jgi:hypothetical protein